MSKFIRWIIKGTIFMCLLTSAFLSGMQYFKSSTPQASTSQIEQQVEVKKIENLQHKETLLRKAFNEQCKLQVASGTIDMQYNFSN